jgi:hypothetical protein
MAAGSSGEYQFDVDSVFIKAVSFPDSADARHDCRRKHLHDHTPRFGRRLGLHGDVTTRAANAVVNPIGVGKCARGNEQEQKGDLTHSSFSAGRQRGIRDVRAAYFRAYSRLGP